MKKTLLTICASMMLAVSYAQTDVPRDCSDLFLSELTFGRPANGDAFDLNYAVEIFNPTQAPVSLSNYSICLSNATNVISSIPLSGTIAPGDVYVVCNSNADLNLRGLADQLSANLDFENNVRLELKNGNTILDRIGQAGTPTSGAIDFNQLAADPYNYLLNFHIDLNDYREIDMRRGMLVSHGDPNFSNSTDILGKWYYEINSDISNIGTHYGICNKGTADVIVGYNTSAKTIYQNPALGPQQDDMSFYVGGLVPGGVNVTHRGDISNAAWGNGPGNDLYFVNNSGATVTPPYVTMTCTSLGTGNYSCAAVRTTGDLTRSSKIIHFIIMNCSAPANYSCIIDQASLSHIVNIKNDNTSVAQGPSAEFAKLYPTVTSRDLNVDCRAEATIKIFDLKGSLIHQKHLTKGLNKVPVSELTAGVYLCCITDSHGQVIYNKIIKD